MDIPGHNRILWHACVEAAKRLPESERIGDPRVYFPFLVRGSWMNDINQATIFTDSISNRENSTADEPLQRLFAELWKKEKGNLLSDMKNGVPESREVYSNAVKEAKNEIINIDDFGKYSRYDHFDIEQNDPKLEYENQTKLKKRNFRASTVHSVLSLKIPSRLNYSTFAADNATRLDYRHLTAFGRALHTAADFFAHTNYIELLLWDLSWKKILNNDVRKGFNSRELFLTESSKPELFCPLPADGKMQKILTAKDTMFWYGESPEKTPLVSALFDGRDTAYSLLQMFAKHLEKVDSGSGDRDMLDLAMAVFGFESGIFDKAAYKVFSGAKKVFNEIGERVRNFLADNIIELASEKEGAQKTALTSLSAVIRKYDSAEAKEWARAAKFRYAAYAMEQDMAKELIKQTPGKPILPHHSLIHKDYLFTNPESALRFRLAAHLATEVTTKLIIMHFSKNPDMKKYKAIAERHLIHPSIQIENRLLDRERLAKWIEKGYAIDWSLLSGAMPEKRSPVIKRHKLFGRNFKIK